MELAWGGGLAGLLTSGTSQKKVANHDFTSAPAGSLRKRCPYRMLGVLSLVIWRDLTSLKANPSPFWANHVQGVRGDSTRIGP